jgi:ABC-type protease/lipase transport system fused ATPase/permease subunit
MALNNTIAQLKRTGTTVIVVSQRAGVLQAVDRVLFMRDGQIASSHSREEALARLSGTSVPAAPGSEAPVRPAAAREVRA